MRKHKTEFFIPGNTPSSKNGRVLTSHGKFIASSAVRKWRHTSAAAFVDQKASFLKALRRVNPPYKIGFYFIRNSTRIFDIVNPLQTMQDAMVHHGWLDDDNVHVLIPIPLCIDNKYYHVDKTNAGCIIRILYD